MQKVREEDVTLEELRRVSIVLTNEHVRLMVESHLLKPEEVPDTQRLAAIVQELIDNAIGFPQEGWHQWDEWVKGLE